MWIAFPRLDWNSMFFRPSLYKRFFVSNSHWYGIIFGDKDSFGLFMFV